MERYDLGRVPPLARIVDPPSWSEYVQDLAYHWSVSSTAIVLLVPWSLLLGYVAYYWFLKRPAKQERAALGPFLSFYTLLTDGTTAGFDGQLMSVFHPALFKDGSVEKGLLRAMARCLTATFGPVVRVPRETVALKRDGMQVNCVALVDFARKKQVTCQLSWVRRLVSVKSLELREKEGTTAVGRLFSPDEIVDGIGMAPLWAFHVTSFHVEQNSAGSPARQLDVLKHLRVEEFEYFAESFVERLFERPPAAAVKMMLPALQEKYAKDGAKALEESIRKVVHTAGGLASGGKPSQEVDATLIDEAIVKSVAAPTPDAAAAAAASGGGGDDGRDGLTSIDGIDMVFHVSCLSRDLEVEVRFTFVAMRCYVIRYEIRMLPDQRTQVIVDRDAGSTTIVA